MKARIYTKEIMDYFYEQNSLLYWKNDRGTNKVKNRLAGYLHHTGYYSVTINGNSYLVHRILYQFYHNVILDPNEQVDHINLNKTDNRKENLHIGTHGQNQQNQHTYKNNKSTGIKCMYVTKNKKYYHIRIQGNDVKFSKLYRIDKFSLEEVIEIRNKKLLELHGDFARYD